MGRSKHRTKAKAAAECSPAEKRNADLFDLSDAPVFAHMDRVDKSVSEMTELYLDWMQGRGEFSDLRDVRRTQGMPLLPLELPNTPTEMLHISTGDGMSLEMVRPDKKALAFRWVHFIHRREPGPLASFLRLAEEGASGPMAALKAIESRRPKGLEEPYQDLLPIWLVHRVVIMNGKDGTVLSHTVHAGCRLPFKLLIHRYTPEVLEEFFPPSVFHFNNPDALKTFAGILTEPEAPTIIGFPGPAFDDFQDFGTRIMPTLRAVPDSVGIFIDIPGMTLEQVREALLAPVMEKMPSWSRSSAERFLAFDSASIYGMPSVEQQGAGAKAVSILLAGLKSKDIDTRANFEKALVNGTEPLLVVPSETQAFDAIEAFKKRKETALIDQWMERDGKRIIQEAKEAARKESKEWSKRYQIAEARGQEKDAQIRRLNIALEREQEALQAAKRTLDHQVSRSQAVEAELAETRAEMSRLTLHLSGAGGDAATVLVELDQAHKRIAKLEDTLLTSDALAEHQDEELKAAQRRIRDLEARLESLGSKTLASAGPLDDGRLLRLRAVMDGEPSLEDSLHFLQEQLPGRVVVLAGAMESAQQHDAAGFRLRSRAYSLLWTLVTDFRDALVRGEGDTKAREVFGKDEYAAKESDTGDGNAAMRRERTFSYRGEQVYFGKHLKIGYKPGAEETLRVHFHWDADNALIVIGHCGHHLYKLG